MDNSAFALRSTERLPLSVADQAGLPRRALATREHLRRLMRSTVQLCRRSRDQCLQAPVRPVCLQARFRDSSRNSRSTQPVTALGCLQSKRTNIRIWLQKAPSRASSIRSCIASSCRERICSLTFRSNAERYPFPLVRVLPAFALSSINLIISPATSLPVAVSMPSSPGELFTSMMTGP